MNLRRFRRRRPVEMSPRERDMRWAQDLIEEAKALDRMADAQYGGPYHNDVTDSRWRREAEQKRLEARLVLARLERPA